MAEHNSAGSEYRMGVRHRMRIWRQHIAWRNNGKAKAAYEEAQNSKSNIEGES